MGRPRHGQRSRAQSAWQGGQPAQRPGCGYGKAEVSQQKPEVFCISDPTDEQQAEGFDEFDASAIIEGFLALISACGAEQQQGVTPDVAYNGQISACEHAQRATSADAPADGVGVMPDAITYNAQISACENAQRAHSADAEATEDGVMPDAITDNAQISACEKAQRATSADTKGVPHEGVMRDAIAYTARISACEKGRQPSALPARPPWADEEVEPWAAEEMACASGEGRARLTRNQRRRAAQQRQQEVQSQQQQQEESGLGQTEEGGADICNYLRMQDALHRAELLWDVWLVWRSVVIASGVMKAHGFQGL